MSKARHNRFVSHNAGMVHKKANQQQNDHHRIIYNARFFKNTCYHKYILYICGVNITHSYHESIF